MKLLVSRLEPCAIFRATTGGGEGSSNEGLNLPENRQRRVYWEVDIVLGLL